MRFSLTWFKLPASRKDVHVRITRGEFGLFPSAFQIWYSFICIPFPFFVILCYFLFLILFFSSECPFTFYKTQPFISQPILSALSANPLNSNLLFSQLNSDVESRSFHQNDMIYSTINSDFTRDNSNELPEDLDHSIRFASLGLAARHLFEDLIVRRIVSFTRLIKMTSNIWHSWSYSN